MKRQALCQRRHAATRYALPTKKLPGSGAEAAQCVVCACAGLPPCLFPQRPLRPRSAAFTTSEALASLTTLPGALPVFAEPSSPDLQSLLADFNAKVLLPLHLNDDQQKLVYRQANRAKLEAEPVEITLGDVTLPLQHLDRNRLPKRWQHFRDIVMKSQTRNDWANVVRLLEGFENAGLRVRSRWQIMAVRQLNLAGMHSLVFQALQRVQATGLHLTDRGVLLQVLRGLHDKAATADWDKEETTQALRMAKQVVDLMEAKDHHAANRGEPPADRRGDPVVIALLTELTAVLAQRHGGDSSELAKLVNRLLTALVQTDFEVRRPMRGFPTIWPPPLIDPSSLR